MNAIIPPTGERLLADGIRRAQRQGNQQLLVLLLGSMPHARAYHRRIARALMQESAVRFGGQVYPMRNGDLTLLSPLSSETAGALDPRHLPGTLAELFKADQPESTELLSVWNLEADQALIFQYLQNLLAAEPALLPEDPPSPPPSSVEDISSLLATANIGDLTQRQTAIQITSNRHGGRSMAPLFREITFSVDVLESRLSVTGRTSTDPYLFRHLASRLDPRMMELVLHQFADAPAYNPNLHLNLTIQTLSSARFTQFADGCSILGAKPGIEVPLLEACRDPVQFATARAAVQSRGFPLVIEGVSPLILRLANPASFEPDFVKLDWDASLTNGASVHLAAAIKQLGPERLILQRCQSEEAIHFGLSHGITRFQGRHIDTILAAARLKSCANGDHCTLRQCAERAGAISDSTRRFCANLPLLDRGLPEAPA